MNSITGVPGEHASARLLYTAPDSLYPILPVRTHTVVPGGPTPGEMIDMSRQALMSARTTYLSWWLEAPLS